MTYISELILILVSDLYLFRSPIGVTELILILRSLHLFGDTRSIAEITERILDLRNLILYGSTHKYYLIKCLFGYQLVLVSYPNKSLG